MMAGLAGFASWAGWSQPRVGPQRLEKSFPNTIEACGREQKQQHIRAVKRVFCGEMTAEKHLGQTPPGCRVTPFNQRAFVFAF